MKEMKINEHYIYEIKGVKVGCTKNIENRIKLYSYKGIFYKFDDFKILEILKNKTDEEAEMVEREFQIKLGYNTDDSSYCNSIKAQKIRAQKAVETNRKNETGCFFDKKLQSNAGKIGGKITAEIYKKNGKGLYDSKVQSMGGKASVEVSRKNGTGMFGLKFRAKIKCKYCDIIAEPGNIARWHNEKCKYKFNNIK
jgi:hypothetical protein